jgi:hypothetical protein
MISTHLVEFALRISARGHNLMEADQNLAGGCGGVSGIPHRYQKRSPNAKQLLMSREVPIVPSEQLTLPFGKRAHQFVGPFGKFPGRRYARHASRRDEMAWRSTLAAV